jgi:hypothetical protein
MLLAAFIVTGRGLADPLASPLHATNECPEFGVAVRLTTVPDA